MTELASKRIQKELAAMLNDPPPGCTLLQMGDDIFRWYVEIQGPPDSPFEGGTYTLLVTFPSSYPFKPPRVKFETRIFHPNINQAGDICLDTISSQWAPSISMAQVFMSIVALLSDPNPSDPINWEAARVLREDPDNYNRMVRDMVARQRGGRTTGSVGRGSASRSMASRAGEIEGQGEDVAEETNGDERGVGEDDEREGGAAGEGVVDDGVNNEEGGAVEQRVGGARDDQAHEEDESEYLALEGDEGEALAREGAGEEDTVQEGSGGEGFVHEVDGGDLEQEGVE